MTGDQVVRRARASHAPGKNVLARAWRSERYARSKMRVQRRGLSTFRDASDGSFPPGSPATIGEPDGKAVVDTKRNPRADTFAEQLEADIFAELGQAEQVPLTEPIGSVTVFS